MATASPLNRRYAEMPPPGGNTTVMSNAGSLANRAPMQMGRPMTPERRMEQMQRRALTNGDDRTVTDIARFQSFQGLQQGWQQRPPPQRPMVTGGPGMPAFAPPALPGEPMAQSPGQSMAAPPQRPMVTGGPGMPAFTPPALPGEPMPPVVFSNMMPPLPMASRPGVPEVPRGLENMMPGLNSFDPKAPLPPSTLLGGTGVPTPPMFGTAPLAGTDQMMMLQNGMPTGKTVARSAPAKPVLSNAQLAKIRAAGMEHTGEFTANGEPQLRPISEGNSSWQLTDIPGPMITDPVTKQQVPGPSRKVQVNRITGEYREIKPEGSAGKADASPATPQSPSWMTWLNEKTAK